MTTHTDRRAPTPSDPWGPRLVDTPSRLVFQTMGTVVSLDVPTGLDARQRDAFQGIFADLDARFSLYRNGSEATAVSTGRLAVTRSSEAFRAAFDVAQEWYVRTDGAFTPYPPVGGMDLGGVVKGRAIRAAGELLDHWGVASWCLDAGGDVLVRNAPTGSPWVIGIVDPFDRDQLLTKVLLDGHPYRALATSGVAERGEHIWRVPGADNVVQASVLADDIVTADVLATAVVAGGQATMQHVVADQAVLGHPVEVLSVGEDHLMTGTPGFADIITAPGSRVDGEHRFRSGRRG